LVREPSAVVRSFEKKNIEQPSKSSLLATLYYFFVNLLCQLTLVLIASRVKSVKVKYEDFIQTPDVIFQMIGEKLEVDLSDVREILRTDEAFVVGNLFDGNRIRMNKKVRLIRDHAEKPKGLKYAFARLINLPFYN